MLTQVGEHIWLVTFMRYDLGYFDDETCRLKAVLTAQLFHEAAPQDAATLHEWTLRGGPESHSGPS